jgi:hypothetical protein
MSRAEGRVPGDEDGCPPKWVGKHSVVNRRLARDRHLSAGAHLGGDHARVLRPVVAHCAEDGGLAETRRQELLEEGAAFPGPGYSGEPAFLAVTNLRWNRLT